MEIGKLTNDQLREIIFSKIDYKDPRVLVGSGIGEDCSIVDFKDELCVISSDPITATTKNMGKLGVYVACNDIATKGIKPFAIMATLLAPPNSSIGEVEEIIRDILLVCSELQIELIGGHTEVSDAVNRPVLSMTALGSGKKEDLVDGKLKINKGDLLIMTKYAACEGTTILCNEFPERVMDKLSKEDKEDLEMLSTSLSVIAEGIIGGKVGAKLMHDATEGGILGAAWEIAEKAKLGIEIYKDEIPILPITRKIAKEFKLDPLKLISSGVMLIVISPEREKILIEELKNKGVKGTVIGKFRQGKSIVKSNGIEIDLEAPTADEIYRAYE